MHACLLTCLLPAGNNMLATCKQHQLSGTTATKEIHGQLQAGKQLYTIQTALVVRTVTHAGIPATNPEGFFRSHTCVYTHITWILEKPHKSKARCRDFEQQLTQSLAKQIQP